MVDLISTHLLALVLGKTAREIISEACKDHLKDKLKSLFGWLERLGERDKVELAYQDAMERAICACLEMLLRNIKSSGYEDHELKVYKSSLEIFMRDPLVAAELSDSIREIEREDLPSAELLCERWKDLGGRKLPSDNLWKQVVLAFRRQARKTHILSDHLREVLNAQTLQQLRKLIERQGGVKIEVRLEKYSQRMLTRFAPVDLANLMPAYAEDPGRMVIRDVFVAQQVRKNPPPELPKDPAVRLTKEGRPATADDAVKDSIRRKEERLRKAYVWQTPTPVLDVISAHDNRLVVLIGEPGSGKSTLMRYLLTGILETPCDPEAGQPLPWTVSFENTFPLLIELRDFYALRSRGECDSFLEYCTYMGKTDQWFIDDHAIHEHLKNGTSLVMFDGLDEVFDNADRERIIHEIIGFATRYSDARIIVTSRPVGYQERMLNGAGFKHFGIQDLGDKQIKTFIQGWFALVFPQNIEQAQERIKRVLSSLRQSKSIRLLAGNPMLLTIMALLAREEELPRERAKFYEKAVEVLCHHWDANRNLNLPHDRYLNADDKKGLLKQIAMRMQSGESGLKGNFIEEEILEQEIQDFLLEQQLKPNAADAKHAARVLIKQLRTRNYILCLRGKRLYGFLHRTFLEYLTATEYVRLFDRQPQQLTEDGLVELFHQHCGDDEWREVLRLICGQIDEQFVGRIVTELADRTDLRVWDGSAYLNELVLAGLCLCETRGTKTCADAGQILLSKYVKVMKQAGGSGEHEILDRLLDDIVSVSHELGPRWPGQDEVDLSRVPEFEWEYGGGRAWAAFVTNIRPDPALAQKLAVCGHPMVRAGAFRVLAERWPDVHTRKLLEEYALRDEDKHPRRAALEALTEKWPEEGTRKLLELRAVQDKDEYPRSAALEALSERWPDDRTRELLENRAVQDESGYARSAALVAITERWPDERTRNVLRERAVQDEDEYPRSAALEALAERWLDDSTREFLTKRALLDNDQCVCLTAVHVLAEKWPDGTTRAILAEFAVQEENVNTRLAALWTLAEKWPDETTRKLLRDRVIEDKNEYVRVAALEALAEKWQDDSTRSLLAERSFQDKNAFTRRVAFRVLAEHWPDDNTRSLLTERAVEDKEDITCQAAVRLLATNWPDETTRQFLADHAVQEESVYTRLVIFQALAEKWPDKSTRSLLAERARVDGVAASVLGGQHSHFGADVFSRASVGGSGFFDPRKPISREHIKQAAKKAHDPTEKTIEDMVRTLSKFVGWDITRGSDQR